ncbi:hypothetical protein M409DRAFT_29243 [Zasmidium cellare ATCC 36951]|uniref:Uncharacterized protein n=1 Tax=Zasmidium cellare ATCC 36951 TaxID=1080233 RepID=A0A6A6C022_ZASCE|nr:uncharacterized protein M409DRAFT_29243 [Zasmidium cellare ATCC 36951]KAF2160397.1 hypothetical protein M409DRAFT_29243 [Zasmidium cellare ATCC 36951]
MHLPHLLLATLSLLLPSTLANTRRPDPGFEADTLCTVEVVKNIRLSDPLNNTLLLWPKGSCCTTIDCQLQDFSCPENPAHPSGDGKGGDICCFKASGEGEDFGMCRCGIDANPQGTCF